MKQNIIVVNKMATKKIQKFLWIFKIICRMLIKILRVQAKYKMWCIKSFWRYDCWYDYYKKFNQILTEIFIRGKTLNISTDFITISYFQVPKDVRINFTKFYYENSKQTRALKNCVQKMFDKTIFLFSDWYYPHTSDSALRLKRNLLKRI